jgi:hypothetical protein
MRMREVGLVAAVVMLGVACEMERGRGGFIDRAQGKDLRSMKPDRCPPGQIWGLTEYAPKDCRDDDTRDECKKSCVASGE